MTQYIYASIHDKKLIEKSIQYNAWLMFGKNNQTKIKEFIRIFEQKVQHVKVLPHGSKTEYINVNVPGICRRVDKKNNILAIEMLGYQNAPSSRYGFIEHEGPHEVCHAFADILPLIYAPNVKTKNGVRYCNEMGMISERDANTGEYVGQHYYGKMFNETWMDIYTTIGLVSFDSQFKDSGVTADTVLKTNYKNWGDASTGYSVLTSITRLAIAAFSNNGSINYQNLIGQGYGIVDINTKTRSQRILKANDFIYGIMCDPMHIEQEFDKIMGEGSYRIFAEYLDRLFLNYQKTKSLSPIEVKRVMNILPDYLNRKCNLYLTNETFSQEEINRIIGNFNVIWNSLQQEYGAYFSQEEINNIARRAGVNNNPGDPR